jgi:hypothetical protein
MPLGICHQCERAFVLEDDAPEEGACPRCGIPLERVPVRDMRDLPPLPLNLPKPDPAGSKLR